MPIQRSVVAVPARLASSRLPDKVFVGGDRRQADDSAGAGAMQGGIQR